jgi:hypothetical protein
MDLRGLRDGFAQGRAGRVSTGEGRVVEAWREPFCQVSRSRDRERDLVRVALNDVRCMGGGRVEVVEVFCCPFHQLPG